MPLQVGKETVAEYLTLTAVFFLSLPLFLFFFSFFVLCFHHNVTFFWPRNTLAGWILGNGVSLKNDPFNSGRSATELTLLNIYKWTCISISEAMRTHEAKPDAIFIMCYRAGFLRSLYPAVFCYCCWNDIFFPPHSLLGNLLKEPLVNHSLPLGQLFVHLQNQGWK